jgi:hypothetical protein
VIGVIHISALQIVEKLGSNKKFDLKQELALLAVALNLTMITDSTKEYGGSEIQTSDFPITKN